MKSEQIQEFYEKNPFPKDKIENMEQVQHWSWIQNCIPEEYKLIFKKNLEILDVGCGTGSLSMYLSQFGNVTGIDFSSTSLGYAMKNRNRLNADITFLRKDITKESIKKKFDYIFCCGVLHHIPEHDKAIKNIKSMMHENTLLILSVYCKYLQQSQINDEKIKQKRIKLGYGKEWIMDGFYNPFIRMQNRKELQKDLDRWGFKVIGEWRKIPDWLRVLLKKGYIYNICLKLGENK